MSYLRSVDPRWRDAARDHLDLINEISERNERGEPLPIEMLLPEGMNPVGDQLEILRSRIQSGAGGWMAWCERGPLMLIGDVDHSNPAWSVFEEPGICSHFPEGRDTLMSWLERSQLYECKAPTRRELERTIRAALVRFPLGPAREAAHRSVSSTE